MGFVRTTGSLRPHTSSHKKDSGRTAAAVRAPTVQAGELEALARGTGLGLVVVKAAVEGCAGELAVESEENRGSRFTVRLPLWGTHGGPARQDID